MMTTKYKILKILVENQESDFDNVQVALEKSFPNMSWREINSYLVLLADEKYITALLGDNEEVGKEIFSNNN